MTEIQSQTPGERLASLIIAKRTLLELNRTQLAEFLGITLSTLSRIEAQVRFPSAQLLVQLCQWLGVSAEFIMTGVEPEQTSCSQCIKYQIILKGIFACLGPLSIAPVIEEGSHDDSTAEEPQPGVDLASNQGDLQGSGCECPEGAAR